VRDYLLGLAFALPPALVFTAYRGFNVAVSRPKAVMALQLGALALKVPVNGLLVFGAAVPTPFGSWTLPAFGAAGCAHDRDRLPGCSSAPPSGGCAAIRSIDASASAAPSPGRARPARRHCFASACRWGWRS
jgi:hypothetical protein